MKTSELLPPELDDWVAKIEKYQYQRNPIYTPEDRNGLWTNAYFAGPLVKWQPSTEWSQGGPLIEKYKIQLTVVPKTGNYNGGYLQEDGYMKWLTGPTPLIAAMRAIVNMTYGGNVDE